jgi:uncharacterized protein (TIGR00645 family)
MAAVNGSGTITNSQALIHLAQNGLAHQILYFDRNTMEKLLSSVGSLLYGMRIIMLFFYVGLVAIIFGILGKFLLETYKLMNTLLFGNLEKIDLIIKVLELVDMTMVAQLVWVVALAGVSLFVTTGHFDKTDMKKPDWLDHVNTYNLKLKLAFAIISISGVHALKTYLSGDLSLENIQIVTMVAVIHFTFVLSAIGISFAERLTREAPHSPSTDHATKPATHSTSHS